MNTKISINEGVLKGYMTVGVSRHNELTGRDASDQHPIEAITGLQTALTEKQSTLVSGQNIKTINGENILGSGDIAIGSSVSSVNGKVGAVVLSAEDVGALSEETNIPTKTSELINDSGFLTEHQDISGKQDRLTAGDGITISEDNTISATGGSSDFVAVFYGDDDYRNTSFSEIKNAFDIGRGVKLKDYSNAGPGESEIIEAYLNCSHISETSGTEWFVFTQVSEASVLCIYQVSGDTESGDYEWFSTFDLLQEKLISGSNIKTINNQSLLGHGDLEIGGAVDSVNGKTGEVVLSAEDVNAQPKLTAGENITIDENNVISSTSGGGTFDHNMLNNRDEEGQHPISAIDGLTEALDSKQGKLKAGNNITIDDDGTISSSGGDSGDTSELYLIVRTIKRLLKKALYSEVATSDLVTLDEFLPDGVFQNDNILTIRDQVTATQNSDKLIID